MVLGLGVHLTTAAVCSPSASQNLRLRLLVLVLSVRVSFTQSKARSVSRGASLDKSSLAVGEAPLQVGRRLREGLEFGHTRLLKASRYVRNASPSKQRHRATFCRTLPSVRALQAGGLFSHLIKHHAGISITVRRY